MTSIYPLGIFTGSAHPQLAQEIADLLGVSLGKSTTRILPDGEIHVSLDEVVRDMDVFLVQPCSRPVNDHFMELLLYLDAFRRASVYRVSVVIPYFPYARQDRMASGREAISARVVANLLESMGANRVIYVDIHNRATQGLFNIPVDPLSALPLMAEYFKKRNFHNASVVSPDVGRAGLAGRYAELLNLPLVVMHKRRLSYENTVATHVVGDIKGRRPILIDDIIAGGSVLKQLGSLYERGAEGNTYLSITHPVLLPTALQILDREERIEKLLVTNTIPIPPDRMHPKIEIISVAPLLADIISRIYHGTSILDRLVLS